MNPILVYVICAIVGYLCGCFSLSFLLGKLKGFDIRTRGTNNAGASNAVITLGAKAGVAVGACDIFKSLIPVIVMSLIFPRASYPFAVFITGVACVIGHMHPFYMGFRGGKGFATFIGMMLGIRWWFGLIVLVGVVLVAYLTDYIVSGTVLTVTSLPIFIFFYEASWLGAVIVGALSLLILFRHRKNFVRMANGTESSVRETLLKKERLWKKK